MRQALVACDIGFRNFEPKSARLMVKPCSAAIWTISLASLISRPCASFPFLPDLLQRRNVTLALARETGQLLKLLTDQFGCFTVARGRRNIGQGG